MINSIVSGISVSCPFTLTFTSQFTIIHSHLLITFALPPLLPFLFRSSPLHTLHSTSFFCLLTFFHLFTFLFLFLSKIFPFIYFYFIILQKVGEGYDQPDQNFPIDIPANKLLGKINGKRNKKLNKRNNNKKERERKETYEIRENKISL